MKRKDAILDKSLELLNNIGSNKFNTNLIAKELDISLGNLYYHFRNKEDIILAIFNEVVKEIDYFWKLNSHSTNLNYVINSLVNLTFLLFKKYKFLYLELLSLTLKDSNLKIEYIKLLETQKNKMDIIIKQGIKDNVLKNMDIEEFNDFFESFWYSFSLWFSVKSLEDFNITSSPEEFFQLKNWVCLSINGYLTQKGRKLIKESVG